ncbi:MAG: class I SAM-dependent methyltransferase [Firmicutes bacterium]|nr:class I SAM-dependent methyltransferase [Bacillota bacterium]
MTKKPLLDGVSQDNSAQSFYDALASQYDKFYLDWGSAVREEGAFLRSLLEKEGLPPPASVLDCACGVGTQAIGLAALGYDVTASDISGGELAEAKKRAAAQGVDIRFAQADFRALEDVFAENFDAVIAMDNALPHMLTAADLSRAAASITGRVREGGVFIASIRDYDAILAEKPAYSPPYVHKTEKGQRVLFQTWEWQGDSYDFVQYVIDDEEEVSVSRFACSYRATRRAELTELLYDAGCREVEWLFPEQTGFYQPVVIGRK